MAFPTPEPGCISPNCLDSAPLDLAPTTGICNASLEAGSPPVAEGTAAQSKEEVGSLTEVLVLEHIGGEEGGSTICCQNPCGGECSFHGANTQACSTHGNHHIECGALLHKCECNLPTLVTPSPDILHYLPFILDGARRASKQPHAHDAAMQAPEAATTRGQGVEENQRGQVQGARRGRDGRTQGQRGQPGVSSPLTRRRVELPSPPLLCCPDGFHTNVSPNYLSMRVNHQGDLVPANFIQVKMYDKSIILAMMGQGFPIFRYPVYVAQTVLPSEAPLYSRQDVLILHNKYLGQAWVNQVLVNEGDNRLRAEVHRYRSLMDKADRKGRKLSTLQDCLMNISMDLRANMLRLAGAEAIKQLEDRRA